MIVVGATLKVVPGKEKEAEAVLRRLVDNTQNEEGTLQYALHQAATDPTTFFFYEMYADQEALQAHSTSEGFRALGKELAQYLAGRPELAQYRLLAKK